MRPLAALPLLTALSIGPAVAFADCPRTSALQEGIVVMYGAMDGDVFIRKDATTVAMREFTFGPQTWEINLRHGHYIINDLEMRNGRPLASGAMVYSYEREPAPPRANLDEEFNVVARFSNDPPEREQHRHRFGAAETRSIGTCSLTVIPVTVEYFNEGAFDAREDLWYLPDYGFSFVVAEQGATDRSPTTYQPQRIFAVVR